MAFSMSICLSISMAATQTVPDDNLASVRGGLFIRTACLGSPESGDLRMSQYPAAPRVLPRGGLRAMASEDLGLGVQDGLQSRAGPGPACIARRLTA